MEYDYELEQMEKRAEALPDELAELLVSPETAVHIDALSEKYQLAAEQRDLVLEEVGRVVFGFLPLQQFKDRLESRLKLPAPRATALAADIDRDIFASVHAEIAQMERLSDAVATPPALPTNPAPVSLADQVARYEEKKRQVASERQNAPRPAGNAPVPPGPSTPDAAPPAPPPSPVAKPDGYREPLA